MESTQTACERILALPLTSYMIMDKLLHFSVPHFPSLVFHKIWNTRVPTWSLLSQVWHAASSHNYHMGGCASEQALEPSLTTTLDSCSSAPELLTFQLFETHMNLITEYFQVDTMKMMF